MFKISLMDVGLNISCNLKKFSFNKLYIKNERMSERVSGNKAV